MTDAALVPSVDRPAEVDWQALSFRDCEAAVGQAWRGYQTRTVVDGWGVGRGLRRLRNEMSKRGDWLPFLAGIGMDRTWAWRLLRLADGYPDIAMLRDATSVEAAIKALPPRRPAPEPAEPAPAAVDPEPDPAAVVEAVATEAAPDPVAVREARLERLALRTEHVEGEVLDVAADKLDKADVRHREDVQAVNDAHRRENAKDRKHVDVRDALLTAKPCACGSGAVHADPVLARFFNVKRKGAAA